jgi:hypothetical protein
MLKWHHNTSSVYKFQNLAAVQFNHLLQTTVIASTTTKAQKDKRTATKRILSRFGCSSEQLKQTNHHKRATLH